MKQMSMELYPARLHRGRGVMGREGGRGSRSESVEGDEEMKVRMKQRKKLNEKVKRNKQSRDCDKQGGERGHVHNLKTPIQSFSSALEVLDFFWL